MRRRDFLASATFIKALPGYRYEFPSDHFSHPDFQTEWWYYTGNLFTKTGRPFGFELTFFRQALQAAVETKSIWSTRDAYMAHLALTDVEGKQFLHAERLNRPGPGLAGVDAKTRRIWNGNWSCLLEPDRHRLVAIDPRFDFQLDLRPAKAPIIHGLGGVSQKGALAGQASHYISFTRLAASGAITLNGQRHEVGGGAWMDHEIFSSELDAGLAGWDWFSIQLDNNCELMLYRLRRKDGKGDPFSAGSFIGTDGKVTHLDNRDFTLRPGRRWKEYPVEWEIEIPRLGVKVSARPRLDDQELTSVSKLAPSYWEGASTFTGTHKGYGYIEMTGYDRNLTFTRREAVKK